MYPQLKYLSSEKFNNNFYKISFWVKQLKQGSDKVSIYIGEVDIKIQIFSKSCSFFIGKTLIMQDKWDIQGWILFQLTYQNKNGIFKYQRDNYVRELEIPQFFQYNLRLQIKPYKNIIFTEALLQISQYSRSVLCVPGCLKCDNNGYCLYCDIGYLQIDNFCECQQDFQFFFLPSECYVKLEYEIVELDRSRNNCPTFGGQKCPQCELKRDGNFSYCFFATDIHLHSQILELDFNYYHILIEYQLLEDYYEIVKITSYEDRYSNIIQYQELKWDFYLIGSTVTYDKVCFRGFYYGQVCKRIIKQCKIQLQNQVCRQCLQKSFLLNGRCKKCPTKCEFCKIIDNQLLCIKCVKNYFLNFQRKCILCTLQYCEMCYLYNGNQNTLERNFNIQMLNFPFKLGCSYCQESSLLLIEQRICVKIDYYSNVLTINEKKFENTEILCNILGEIIDLCKLQIPECFFCQAGQCLFCYENYILDIKSNKCQFKYNNQLIYNSYLMIQDFEMIFSLITFLYYNYSYIEIIQQQQQYFLLNCQFNNYDGEPENIECNRAIEYFTDQMEDCTVYCVQCSNCLNNRYRIYFKLNFTGQYFWNTFELEMKNSYIDWIQDIKEYESNTNKINVLINENTDQLLQNQLFQIIANIPNHPEVYQINLQFTNSFILEDDYLYFEESVQIINSSFNIFKNFKVEFNSKNKGQLLLRDVIFKGLNGSSSLILKIKSYRFQIQNVSIQNFSRLSFEVESDFLLIENLNLTNLTINHQNFYYTVIFIKSISVNFSGLYIQNCNFTKISLLNIASDRIQIQKVYILNLQIISSRLIKLYSQQFQSIIFKNIYIQSIDIYDSELFQLESLIQKNQVQLQITEVLISKSKFHISIIFVIIEVTQRWYVLTISKILMMNNQFNNSVFVDLVSDIIKLIRIFIQDNYFNQNEHFIKIDSRTSFIKQFYFYNNMKYFHWLIIINAKNEIYIYNFLLKNCSFVANQNPNKTYVLIDLSSHEISIRNLYFIDINLSLSLIEASCNLGQLDNLQIINLNMLETQLFLINFFNYDENQILFYSNTIYLDNVQHSHEEIDENLSGIKQIIQIRFKKISWSDLVITNIRAPYLRLISILDCKKFYLTQFKGQNISIQILISSIAFSNDVSEIQLQEIFPTQYIFCFEPQNSIELESLLYNVMLFKIEQQFKSSLIYFRFTYDQGVKFIFVHNIDGKYISSEKLIEIVTKFTVIQINHIQIINSNLQSIINSDDWSNKFIIQFAKFQNLTSDFNQLFNFNIKGDYIILSDMLFVNLFNIYFVIYPKNFKIHDIMFLNTQFQFFQILSFTYNLIPSQCVINNMYFINAKYVEIDEGMIFLHKYDGQIYIHNLQIHNSTLSDDSTLLSFLGQFNLMLVSITNNKCGQACIQVQQNSKVLFHAIDFFQNEHQNESPLKSDLNSKVYNFPFLAIKNDIAIQINQNVILNKNQSNQLLYLPSGQKLTEYRLHDFVNNHLIQLIQNIQIIRYSNSKNEIVFGLFSIKVHEYDQTNHKIVRNLSDFQNIKVFEQQKDHFGLNEFQIIYNPYQQNILMIEIEKIGDSQQKLKIFAKTQLCQMGEILINNQCLVCRPELQIYSLKQKSNYCQIVDKQIISDHQQGAIKLRQGYWRPFAYNSYIEQCDFQMDKCDGGWRTGDISCKIGYIGAICNACDIYNTRGNGYFLLEQNECMLCGEFKYLHLIFKLTSIILILCLRLIISLNSNILNYKKLMLQRLVNYRHFYILAKYITDIPSVIFTILIGNLAILKFIIQDSIDLPDILTIFTNPIIIEQNSSLCIQQLTNLDYNYWLYYFKLIIPILTYNIFILLVAITLKRQNIIKIYFLFPIISLLLSLGPTLLVLFIKQAIYITYSNVKYANFDYSIRYYSRAHQQNLKYIILPLIFLLGIILPIMLMHLIRKQAKNILKCKSIQLGIFILPYKSNYQELFNYYKNTLLLLLLTLNDKQLSFYNQTQIITIIMYISFKNHIYKIKHLSYRATQSAINLVCILLVLFFLKQTNALNQLYILHILSFLFIIQQFKGYIQIFYCQNKLQIFELLQNYNFIIKFLGLKKYIQCLEHWKLIKQNYKLIIQQRLVMKDQQSFNDIILQTVNTQNTNNSLIEIEMMQL